MKRVGFEFLETMTGTYTLASQPGSARRFRFTGQVTAPDALQHLRDNRADLRGTLHADGFADGVPIAGALEIAPFIGRFIRYQFGFVGNDGRAYQFAGQKRIRLLNLLASWTHLRGTIQDSTGREVATVELAFDLRSDLVSFLRSWKPTL